MPTVRTLTSSVTPDLDLVYKKWEQRNPRQDENRNSSMSSSGSVPPSRNGHVTDRILKEGRQRWRDKFGENIQPPNHRKSRGSRRRVTNLDSEEATGSKLASFKLKPIVTPDSLIVTRPFMGMCCKCMPDSKRDFVNSTTGQQGMRDMLSIKSEIRYKYLMDRTFEYAVYALRMRDIHKYNDVSVSVLASCSVREAVQQQIDQGSKKSKANCAKILQSMKAVFSNRLLRTAVWFLLKFLPYFITSVQVHKGQMQMVEHAGKRGVPVIYIPLHRSHLDYILVQFILRRYDIRCPHIAAGDNLNIPFFGWLMKSLGGFFIRRKLDKQAGKKDMVYRAVLHSYIQELLRSGESFKFFIEGGRTRSGKPSTPKGGLMSVVVDAVSNDVIEDAYIVPISINYEKLPEGNFNREQMGLSKKKESFFGALKAIWEVYRSHFGSVRVEFSQPFSLREYLQRNQPPPPVNLSGSSSDNSIEECAQQPARSSSLTSLFGTDVVNEDQRQLVKSLSEHITYTSVRATPIMCTNMIAFLLLTKHRQGVSMKTLITDLDWLKEELKVKGQDVSFVGETYDVIEYACDLLGPNIVKLRYSSDDPSAVDYIKPCLSLPGVFELNYYSNTIVSAFLLESVLICSVIYHCDIELYIPEPINKREAATACIGDILETAIDLCKLLKYEFTFAPPCCDLQEMLSEQIYQLISMEIFQTQDSQVESELDHYDRGWSKRFSATVSWEDEEDMDSRDVLEEQYVKVNIEGEDCVQKMMFYHSVLGPFLESYLVAARQINLSLKSEMPENDFLHKIQNFAKDRIEKGIANYTESAAFDTLRNSLKIYQDLKIIDCYYAGNLRMVGLHDHFQVKEKLNNYINLLETLQE